MSDTPPAHQAIAAVKARYPNLTSHGFESEMRPSFAQHRDDMLSPFYIEQFECAVAWLREVPRRATPNREHGHSYALKHAAENWCGRYVSNGALIAAAIHLGLPIAQCPSFINCWIGVASRRKWPK